MIVELGHFALCLALAAALVQAIIPLLAVHSGSASGMRFADNSAQIQFICTALAFAALTWAYVVSDFSVVNVALNSHSSKPMLYKVTGVWANHEGSMLLWVLMLALFGVLISVFGKAIPVNVRATVLSVQAMVGAGFYLFILFTSNPFARIANPPLDGQGMNPLLQDIGVALHPPLLYVGYVGFSIAFSFAVAALILGRVDPAWARWMRPWVLFAWSGLTAGIALGSWWAYYELGWGGFWFWDPVENASFMPWLLATALLHSATVVEKRAALIKWTVLLAIFTFAFSLLGTFLVRSGIITSVHSFASDPQRGVFILALLVLAIGGSLALFVWRANALNEGGKFAIFSRESGLLLNNVLLTAACGVVFIGTLYPLFLEAVNGQRITVGPPFFNKTFLPIFSVIIFAAAIGPLLAWKRADIRTVSRNALYLVAGAAVGTLIIALAIRVDEPVGIFGIFIALFLGLGTLFELARRAGLPKADLSTALGRIAGLPRSAWGLYLGHIGLAFVAAGIVAISIWRIEVVQITKPGDAVPVGNYEYTLMDVRQSTGPNYQTSIATVKVEQDGETITLLYPERRWYPVEQKPTTEAGIETRWHGDFYAVLGDPDGSGNFVVRFYYNPGVPWMWLGAILAALAGLVSLTDRRLKIGIPAKRKKFVPVPAE